MGKYRELNLVELVRTYKTLAVTGAGGKTTLMFSLARQLVETGKKVITTTTTHIFSPTAHQSPMTILKSLDETLSTLPSALLNLGHVTIGREIDLTTGKLKGVDLETILRLGQLSDYTIIEADGAAGRLVKAPEAWEPVIPPFVDCVVFVMGLDSLGQRVDENTVFRVNRFCQVTGLAPNCAITPESLARLAYHPTGGLKGVPSEAQFIVLLNKMDRLSHPGDLDTLWRAFEKEKATRLSMMVVAANLITGSLVVLKE